MKLRHKSLSFPGVILAALFLLSQVYAQQININRIELMPNMPSPYEMRDWKQAAAGYDSLVFDFNLTGQYLPLIWLNTNTINYPDHNSFGLHTVVGTTVPSSSEAINLIPAVTARCEVTLNPTRAWHGLCAGSMFPPVCRH